MGKTIKKSIAPRRGGRATHAPKTTSASVEQQRQVLAVAEFFRTKRNAWCQLSIAERRKQVAAWDRMKRAVNTERTGYRKVFVA